MQTDVKADGLYQDRVQIGDVIDYVTYFGDVVLTRYRHSKPYGDFYVLRLYIEEIGDIYQYLPIKVTKWNRFFAFDTEEDESKRDVGPQDAEMIRKAIDLFGEFIREWEEYRKTWDTTQSGDRKVSKWLNVEE